MMPAIKIAKMPIVFRMYDSIENVLVEIVEVVNIEIPISSGNGEAIMNPPMTGSR